MNLDDVARSAAQDVSAKADSVETPEFAAVQRHRQKRTRWTVATSLVATAALFVGVAFLAPFSDTDTRVVSDSVPAPTTSILVPDRRDPEAARDDIKAIEDELARLEEEQQAIEEEIRDGTTSVTLATGTGNLDPSGRDPLEIPHVFDLAEQRGIWTRIDDPGGIFAIEPFIESRERNDGGVSSSSSGVKLGGVVEGPGGLVAAGSVTRGLSSIGAMWRSTDGLTWERIPHNPAVFGSLEEGSDVAVQSIASDGSVYVAVGTSGNTAIAWTSRDAVTWNAHLVQASEGDMMWPIGLERVESGWIATGSESNTARPPDSEFSPPTVVHSQGAIWWSPNGREWQRVESESLVSSTSNLHVLDVVETPMGIFAVGIESWDPATRSDGAVWFSDDGLAWDRVETSDSFGPGETGIESIAARNGVLVAVGSSRSAARIWHSIDGVTWNVVAEEAPTGDETWVRAQDLVATDSGFVAVGVSISTQKDVISPVYRTVAWSSHDGISWSLLEQPEDRADGFVWDVIDFDGNLIAVGELNAIPSGFDADGTVSLGADVGAVWLTQTP